MPIIGGGVAFFGFLAIFPALIAMISLYGLVASPETVAQQVEDLSAQLPERRRAAHRGAAERDRRQQRQRAHASSLVVSILAALWSASGGVGNLITAVNLAYDEVETRNFVKLKLTVAGADARRDRLRARHVRPRRRRPGGARRAAARRRRHDPRPGRALGAAARRSSPVRSPSSTGSPPTGTRRGSAGSASARSSSPSSGRSSASASASTSTTSGPTTRPTARSPASSC